MSNVITPALSKRAMRRLLCTANVHEVVEVHKDGRARKIRRGRFHTGLYLDRSKYKP